MNRDKNIAIFKDTLAQSKSLYKYDGIIDNIATEVKLPIKHDNTTHKDGIGSKLPKIHITMDDCTKLIENNNDNKRGILVDSASLKNPGGGVRNGSNAQEENLCRQSNLYQAIEKLPFPLHNKTVGVYISDVTFFKAGPDYKYAPLETNKKVNIVMLFSRPRTVFNTEDESYSHHLIAFKSLIAFANKYNAEYIIIPPIGSGVFGNNPYTVAKALQDAIHMFEMPTVKNIYVSCYNNVTNMNAYTEIFGIT